MQTGKLLVLENKILVPTSRSLVLSLLSFIKLVVNHDFIADRQLVREEGGRAELCLLAK